MKSNGYRDLVGIKFSNDGDFEKGTEIIFKTGCAFELIQHNIFLVASDVVALLEGALQKEGIVTKRIAVVSINDLPPEERAHIRRENLKGALPIPL